ncbi:MAG: hypothetical protein NTY86_08725, partial [Deltaproteobacteria bacterium]|nr:hypothetical protein [Deltaproteobacteria bacterium]
MPGYVERNWGHDTASCPQPGEKRPEPALPSDRRNASGAQEAGGVQEFPASGPFLQVEGVFCR